MRISAIVVTRNTRDLTLDCLASIYRAPPTCELEVVVVDNASSDATAEALRERFPQARLIECERNLGFGAACNRGAREASGELLAFLNSDTVVQPGAFDLLVSAMESNPRAGAVAPQLVDPDGREQETAAYPMTPATELLRSARKRAKRRVTSALSAGDCLDGVAYLSGAALLLRREAFQAIGGFDESFFIYFEDMDLCKRLADAGWELVLVAEARVIHSGGCSTEQTRCVAFVEMMRSRSHFIRKHWGRAAAFAMALRQFVSCARRAGIGIVGVVFTLGLVRRIRRKAGMNVVACVWFMLGMPARDRWMYRRLVERGEA